MVEFASVISLALASSERDRLLTLGLRGPEDPSERDRLLKLGPLLEALN